MKNNGFFSVYALIWLNIACAVALLMLYTAMAVRTAKSDMTLYHAQIAAVYRCKARLKQMGECVSRQAEEQDQEQDQQEEALSCTAKPDVFYYRDIRILITYQDTYCDIYLDDHFLRMYYDLHTQDITDMEYLN